MFFDKTLDSFEVVILTFLKTNIFAGTATDEFFSSISLYYRLLSSDICYGCIDYQSIYTKSFRNKERELVEKSASVSNI